MATSKKSKKTAKKTAKKAARPRVPKVELKATAVAKAKKLVEEKGVRNAALDIGIDHTTLTRALAGIKVRNGSAAIINALV